MAVRAVIAGVQNSGVAREQMMTDVGLGPADLEDGLARIPWQRYCHVIRAALSRSSDPALGLHMTEHPSYGAFDAFSHLAQSSGNLREAIQICVRYARLAIDSDAPLAFHENGSKATLRLSIARDDTDSPAGRFIAEFAIAGLYLRLLRPFVGVAAIPHRVYFAHRAPAYRAEYTRIFAGRECFGQAFSGLEFDRAWLECTQVHHVPELRDLLQARVDSLLARIDREAAATLRVQRWLGSHFQHEKPSIAEIARDLGMSTRSLRRRLREEGANCSELIEDALADRAKRMLSERHCSVQETAFALGFATHAAFTRAFKRWTGMPPSEFRSSHKW